MPATRIRPVGHEDRLSLVDHLGELRTRLFVSLGFFLLAGSVCFWQNHAILEVVNAPLDGKKPITLGVAEQFTTTLTVSAYAAILISLPVLLYQAYAFILPAFSPTERRVALPLLLMVPVLFIAGASFAYFIVLEPAIEFLLGFNNDEFQTELRAKEYYSFVALFLISMGAFFQMPVALITLTKLGIVTPEQLKANRRYAILVIAIAAALLPTIDPVTLILEMVPLLLLYEMSIHLASFFGRPSPEAAERMAAAKDEE